MSKNWKIFWPSWLMPFVLIGASIYIEIFGTPPRIVIILVLAIAVIMLGRPMGHYMTKQLSFEQIALNGLFIPFVIWVVLVVIKIILMSIFS